MQKQLYKPNDVAENVYDNGMSRRVFIKTAWGVLAAAGLSGVGLLVNGCVGTPKVPLVPLNPGTLNTLTYNDENGKKQTVYDISGEWDAEYSIYGRGFNKDIVKITQTGSNFVGVKVIGNEYIGKGGETIRGELEKNGFKTVYSMHSLKGWVRSSGEISREGNGITIISNDFSIKLERK